jgi:hypothetical protein
MYGAGPVICLARGLEDQRAESCGMYGEHAGGQQEGAFLRTNLQSCVPERQLQQQLPEIGCLALRNINSSNRTLEDLAEYFRIPLLP